MKVHVDILGTGEVIVFLHGWGLNQSMMNPLIYQLSHDYKCVSFDLFGFGESDEIENYHCFDDYVDAVHDLFIQYDIKNPILLAHSFGARIAIGYASKYKTKALILTGAAGLKSKKTWLKMIKQTLHRLGFKNQGSNDYEHASAFQRKVLVDVVNRDLSKEITMIQQPVLLVWGSEDTETPLWMAKRMKRLFQKALLIIFKNDDHFAYYHQSSRFCFIVKEFLEEADS